MTKTLIDKLEAAAHTEVFHGSGAQRSIALDKAIAIVREHTDTEAPDLRKLMLKAYELIKQGEIFEATAILKLVGEESKQG